ncbi:hypothetical protein ACH4S8_36140 [Streptomyces sp. NPDC021080]|uniref:hypothetical protein n=1 Tax=Streptomyces sp. NPDC021080 TaxID=3365110 RepID=UPI0037B70C3A
MREYRMRSSLHFGLARLSEPFPVQGPDPARVLALLEERPEEEDFEGIEDFDQAYEAWGEKWDPVMRNPERTVGAVVLCHAGCAYRRWLVVSGPERGRTWSDDRVDERDLEPLLGPEQEPVTFSRRYRDRLAEELRAAEGNR